MSQKRKRAFPLWYWVIAAVIVQMAYTMIISGGVQVMGPSSAIMPSVVILIAAALLCFSWFALRRGWFGKANPAAEHE